MLHIYDNSKIYVHAPAGIVTGGVELLHQLVSLLRVHGKEAYIVYYGKNEKIIPADYIKYNIVQSSIVDDDYKNIEVYSETMLESLMDNKRKTQKFLWWLSIDNAFLNVPIENMTLKEIKALYPKRFYSLLMYFVKRFIRGYNDFHTISFLSPFKGLYCGYQSEYIKDTLQKLGFKNLVALKDYINTDHIRDFDITSRKNIVLYNPSKGYEFTKQLIDLAPDLEWVALKGMSRENLIETIRSAKTYIDFGNHPGKDRLPRECAINGCCVITGMRGSAGYFEDVPIDDKYKFDENIASLSTILDCIRWTLNNYETAINDFEYYRNIIKKDKEEFENQAKSVFQY